MKRILFFLLLILGVFIITNPAYAFEVRKGNDVTVSKDTTIKGSLVAGGNTITIDGTVDGDLYCGTQTLVIRGTVTGDVICGAQTMNINGSVGGSVRSASQLLDITGTVGRNVTSIGQTLQFNSNIGGEVLAAAQTVSIGENAQVAGDFTYTSQTPLTEATGTAIVGKLTYYAPPKEGNRVMSARNLIPRAKPWPANAVGGILFYLVVGIVVVSVAKDYAGKVTKQMFSRPWFDILMGFLTMIAVPMAIVIVGITIIGIPIAMLLVLAFILLIMLARIYVSLVVGEKITEALGRKKSGMVIQVIIGVAIIELLVKLPIIGILLSGITTLWGMGGIVMSFGKRKTGK